MVVSNGFDRIRWPYSIIREFGSYVSVGNEYGEIMKQAPFGALTIMDNSQCLITLNKETCYVLRRIGCALSNVNILYSERPWPGD